MVIKLTPVAWMTLAALVCCSCSGERRRDEADAPFVGRFGHVKIAVPQHPALASAYLRGDPGGEHEAVMAYFAFCPDTEETRDLAICMRIRALGVNSQGIRVLLFSPFRNATDRYVFFREQPAGLLPQAASLVPLNRQKVEQLMASSTAEGSMLRRLQLPQAAFTTTNQRWPVAVCFQPTNGPQPTCKTGFLVKDMFVEIEWSFEKGRTADQRYILEVSTLINHQVKELSVD